MTEQDARADVALFGRALLLDAGGGARYRGRAAAAAGGRDVMRRQSFHTRMALSDTWCLEPAGKDSASPIDRAHRHRGETPAEYEGGETGVS